MRLGKFYVQKKRYSSNSNCDSVDRIGYVNVLPLIIFGTLLSGCVATALTPPEGISAAAFSAGSTVVDPTKITDNTEGQTAGNAEAVAAPSQYVPLPAQKPTLASSNEKQLALASSTNTSPAANAAEKIAEKATAQNQVTPLEIKSQVTEPKKPIRKGFFASLFDGNKDRQAAKPAGSAKNIEKKSRPIQNPIASNSRKPIEKPTKPAANSFFATLFNNNKSRSASRSATPDKKQSGKNSKPRRVAVFKPVGKGNLPGVRKLGLFGIYESREGADEGYGAPIRVASVGGLARSNGLRVQRAAVQVSCFKPALVRMIKQVQRHYGKVPVVTSGYRSPSYNRRVRGARNSMHIYCKAADIQVDGVSKWALAKYMRTIPGRGGIGTYCYTNSVHIDVGTKRDWNWRCRRGKRGRRG